MQIRQSEGGQDPRRAAGDVPDPEQFTDLIPVLPVCKSKQEANTLGAILYLILLTVYAAFILSSAMLMPQLHSDLLKSITCSCNVVFLAVTGLLQRHLVAEQQKEKRQGYIKFSRRLDSIIHLPFTIFSFGTSGVLLVIAWEPKEYEDGICPIFLIRALILLEISLTSIVIGAYLRLVYRHRVMERHPDVMKSLYSALNHPVPLGSVRDNDGALAEQQALLLDYQRDHLRYLSEEILKLQDALSKFAYSHDGNTPQVDVAHLLAAREQELRAVSAERYQLLAELRMARTLIADRDADIKHVQAINHQYVEETERVRSMLDEWSRWTAKLEIAVEAERLLHADLQKRVSMLQHS